MAQSSISLYMHATVRDKTGNIQCETSKYVSDDYSSKQIIIAGGGPTIGGCLVRHELGSTPCQ